MQLNNDIGVPGFCIFNGYCQDSQVILLEEGAKGIFTTGAFVRTF